MNAFCFFCKAYFLLETVLIIPVYVSEQTFLIFVQEKDAATVFFWTHFGRRDQVCLHLHSHYFLHGSHSFFNVFFNGSGFYPQTTAVISAWFVDRYSDQSRQGLIFRCVDTSDIMCGGGSAEKKTWIFIFSSHFLIFFFFFFVFLYIIIDLWIMS